jgi:hypothetical protein
LCATLREKVWSMSLPRRLRSYYRLPQQDRRLVREAGTLLLLAWLAIRVIPFRRLAPRLGRSQLESPVTQSPEAVVIARRVAWAIHVAARQFPWFMNCFPRAIAAKLMLRRRGVEATLYLGVRRDAALKAHAWVRVGPFIVTGRQERIRFTVVSSFA